MCYEILITFREENGRVPLKIFVEFLRPVIKEERENTNEASTSAGHPSEVSVDDIEDSDEAEDNETLPYWHE